MSTFGSVATAPFAHTDWKLQQSGGTRWAAPGPLLLLKSILILLKMLQLCLYFNDHSFTIYVHRHSDTFSACTPCCPMSNEGNELEENIASPKT